ncbi:hypothetical protein PC118_g22443 [Phytophthora cactorum]|uniref:Tc1-like transposase DDE domain-containing protein n=2 Tax=Phytophthora cactorum TaxID=29920 RepID=A0A8T1ET76_9STRA|nr:hypothetical protein PC114_g22269 [Phytophthora cactorum]KAG2960559.1 hypothetical protein PC118_g22443 [Phytophthora cactorum]KAG2978178.1 hypothetical protein PC119_g21806 [Phytophthora cactorum]KAG3059461.1 hypothetical protein PC122_g20313 [Phytophthora cactorum]
MPRAPPRLSSSTPPRCVATKEERQRVLDAYEAGDDWLTVARYNNVSRAAAYRLCKSGDPRPPPGGGARANCVKCTNEMVSALKDYLEEDCTLTLVQLHDKIMDRFQIRKEPSTCNSEVNKAKRYTFATELVRHQTNGEYIVYYDESNFNFFCMRSQGRAPAGQMADGLVLHQLQRRSIRRGVNAAFLKRIYETVKASATYRVYFVGKKVIIVLDNAPTNNQPEERLKEVIAEHGDLELLCLGLYSPMLNPIEGKSSNDVHATYYSDLMAARVRAGEHLNMTEARMSLLEDAATVSISCMNRLLVVAMALHCQRFVADALKIEDIEYGV